LALFVICSHPVLATQNKLRVQRAMLKQVLCIENVGNALSSSHFFCVFPQVQTLTCSFWVTSNTGHSELA
jgi:hypothetical protein